MLFVYIYNSAGHRKEYRHTERNIDVTCANALKFLSYALPKHLYMKNDVIITFRLLKTKMITRATSLPTSLNYDCMPEVNKNVCKFFLGVYGYNAQIRAQILFFQGCNSSVFNYIYFVQFLLYLHVICLLFYFIFKAFEKKKIKHIRNG